MWSVNLLTVKVIGYTAIYEWITLCVLILLLYNENYLTKKLKEDLNCLKCFTV